MWHTYKFYTLAANGLDYTGGTFDLTFSGMPSHTIVNDTQCSLLQVLDDDLVEGRETLILAIRTSNPNILLLTNQTTTVSIIDDEGMQFFVYLIQKLHVSPCI